MEQEAQIYRIWYNNNEGNNVWTTARCPAFWSLYTIEQRMLQCADVVKVTAIEESSTDDWTRDFIDTTY